MPFLSTQKQLRAAQQLTFCYVCGQPFSPNVQRNRDHVPALACFDATDRINPLILPTHVDCNSEHKLSDEKIGQLIGARTGRAVAEENRRLQGAELNVDGRSLVALTNLNLHAVIWRWVRAFHGALYAEFLDAATPYTLEAPLPRADWTGGTPRIEALKPQHAKFVELIKTNRAARSIDWVACNNGKLLHECVWASSDDGRPFCIFALDLCNWKDLGNIGSAPARGCAGAYMPLSGVRPSAATKSTQLRIALPNFDKLDAFAP